MSDHSPTTRRSSFFARAKSSFFRSHGEKGADVTTLRGTAGSDFEGEAKVSRSGVNDTLCSCFGGGKKGKSKTYFVLVKGPSCFIFSNKNSPSPEYAINLEKKNAKLHKAHKKRNSCFSDTRKRLRRR